MEQKAASFRALFQASVGVLRLIARNNRALVIVLLLLAIALGVIPTLENALRGWLINELVDIAGVGVWATSISFLLAAVIGVAYIFGGLQRLDNYLSNVLWYQARETFEFEIIRAKTSISLSQHEDPALANLIQRATERGPDRAQTFAQVSIEVLTSIFGLVATTIALASYAWWIFPLLLIGTLPELFLQVKFGHESWKMNRRNTEPWRHFWTIRNYFWNISSISELKLFNSIPFFVEKARALFSRVNREELDLRWTHFKRSLLSSLLTQGATGFALGYFVWSVIHGQLQIGTLTFLFASVIAFRGSLSHIFRNGGRLYENSLFIHELFGLLQLQPALPEPSAPVTPATDVTPRIAFENVSFTYPGRETPALRNINFVLEPGKKVALIGLNGAGKSTFVKLLCRLYDPSEGRITVNDVDLREIDLASYYRMFGVLFQDFNYYLMPIREAIAIGDVSKPIDDERIRVAAEESRSDVFIQELKDGYNQMLGKEFTHGTSLSGGQWQKIALARLFYRDPRVYVLDEPTSAIDAQSEAEIFNRLDKLPKDKSVLFISHRFSTVRSADEIVVIEDGRITEQGTHHGLMHENGTYKRLFKLQADRYLREGEERGIKNKTSEKSHKKLVK